MAHARDVKDGPGVAAEHQQTSWVGPEGPRLITAVKESGQVPAQRGRLESAIDRTWGLEPVPGGASQGR